jgi:flotillin
MLEKAEALKQYGDAAKQQMQLDAIKVLYEQLPAIAEAIGNGYAKADIHLIGNDSGQLAGNMMGNITQIIEGFKGSTGVDPMSVISGMLGAKIVDNNNQ